MKRLSMAIAAALLVFVAFGEKKVVIRMVKVGGSGEVAFVNTCGAPTANLEELMPKVSDILSVEFKLKTGTWNFAEAQKCYEATKSTVAIFIVKDKSLPMSLVAPESKWGVVNAEGLDASGVSKMSWRVATVLLGGASSRYKGSTMQPVFSVADLKEAGDVVTIDSVMAISGYLPKLGIVPYRWMPPADAEAEGLLPKGAAAKQDK